MYNRSLKTGWFLVNGKKLRTVLTYLQMVFIYLIECTVASQSKYITGDFGVRGVEQKKLHKNT